MVELLISIFIITVLTITVTTFQRDVFSLNFALSGSLNAQIDARHVLRTIVAELREASPSALGAYPIALASSTGVTFYSDVNNDGLKDQVRIFLNGTNLTIGVTYPSGNPLTYNSANEQKSTIISGIVASSTLPLFQYYPSSYTGTTSPLVQPVDISQVRLVKITVIIDKDAIHSPAPVIVTSQVSLRNLKDNL